MPDNADSVEITIEDFWRSIHGDDVVWRTSRQDRQWCGQCLSWAIAKGDRYLDTGEHIGFRATSKCCAACAAKRTTMTVARNG